MNEIVYFCHLPTPDAAKFALLAGFASSVARMTVIF
ncbi:hypothetical protein PANT111_210177 [Pantoea brenneri]|uniref:Uncharacterized protein n=1 Tax=Pantoea brenneri TaxID=472694 RepID=A0AAX3J7S9_9GAMM|nr:hypothetical protein PANT111_210177 [Pantoea brenneri]